MSMLKKIMNNQLKLALEEIEALEHGAERTKLRIMLVNALATTSTVDFEEAKTGKESIKENKAKKPSVVQPEEIDVIEPAGEELNKEDAVDAEITSDEVDQALDATEENVEETTEDENAVESTDEEPKIVLNEDGQEVDITYAYAWVQYAASDEDREALALEITEYDCLEKYAELTELVVTNENGEEELLCDTQSKFLLSYYLTPYEDTENGLEFVNAKVSEFTDGQYDDVMTFVNNENIDALVEHICK